MLVLVNALNEVENEKIEKNLQGGPEDRRGTTGFDML
jgi:hypothetical protein